MIKRKKFKETSEPENHIQKNKDKETEIRQNIEKVTEIRKTYTEKWKLKKHIQGNRNQISIDIGIEKNMDIETENHRQKSPTDKGQKLGSRVKRIGGRSEEDRTNLLEHCLPLQPAHGPFIRW